MSDMETNGFETGCLIGNLAQELAPQNELFRDRLDQILTTWETYFTDCLEVADELELLQPEADTKSLARFILSGWQGAMLRAKVIRSPEPLQTFIHILFERVLAVPIPSSKSTAG